MGLTATRIHQVFLVLALLAGAAAFAQSGAPSETFPPAQFGKPFPRATFKNLNPAVEQVQFDLGDTIGKKSIVLFYWIAGNARADEMFQQVQVLADEIGSDKLAVYGAVLPRPGREVDVIQKRLAELNITLPVLHDENFRLGQQLRVQSVPNLTIIDARGRLRVTNGASFTQTLEYKLDLAKAVRRVAETGSIGPYGYLPRYHPVKELVGKKCPDFKAPLIDTSVERRWSSMLESNKLNVLIFWSVDCPHCRRSLPELNAWLAKNSDGMNLVTAASVTSEANKTKTREFCDLNDFAFPTLVDEDRKIAELYHITTTPTIVIIGPDGVVDSVLLTGGNVQKALEEKKLELL